MPTINLIARFAATFLLVSSPVAHAVIIASEDFSGYPVDSTLSGHNGGTGWNGGWTVGAPQVYLNQVRNNAVNLSYPGYVTPNGGNYANLASGYGGPPFNYIQRTIDLAGNFAPFSATNSGGYAVAGADGTELWGSFIYHNVAGLQMWLQQQTSPSSASNVDFFMPVTGTDSMFLFRISYGSGNADTLDLWSSPDLTTWNPSVTPSSTFSNDLSFSNLIFVAPNSTNEGRIDNIRFGSTAYDVVPEPSNLALASLAALLIARRNRSKPSASAQNS